jgi:hypothetical protein
MINPASAAANTGPIAAQGICSFGICGLASCGLGIRRLDNFCRFNALDAAPGADLADKPTPRFRISTQRQTTFLTLLAQYGEKLGRTRTVPKISDNSNEVSIEFWTLFVIRDPPDILKG